MEERVVLGVVPPIGVVSVIEGVWIVVFAVNVGEGWNGRCIEMGSLFRLLWW